MGRISSIADRCIPHDAKDYCLLRGVSRNYDGVSGLTAAPRCPVRERAEHRRRPIRPAAGVAVVVTIGRRAAAAGSDPRLGRPIVFSS